ncbi:uncharacterized protein LOC110855043 [Folsomia candida]|uniref:Uncharacterized protein n=1 Tax=Folsomia candida TaxID=158441 RepID=A0A226DTR1_FOLCA|nr:uncharacterized protein LOC110855043 [Folsomia candida]OXA48885.1 hypothetical protein Fcan01_16681 [Folsomia candida]
MYKFILYIFLFFAGDANSHGTIEGVKSTILGAVDPLRRCGGLATQRQLRISGCDGYCRFTPGQIYNCENDFMPSQAIPQLNLRVEICLSGDICMTIINYEMPNSSVQPGFLYTAKYSFVPNDILSGRTVEFRASLLHSNDLHVEVCVAADVDVL